MCGKFEQRDEALPRIAIHLDLRRLETESLGRVGGGIDLFTVIGSLPQNQSVHLWQRFMRQLDPLCGELRLPDKDTRSISAGMPDALSALSP